MARGGGESGTAIDGGMSEKRKRDAPTSYRPPQELREEFMRRVESSGLPVNAFITQAVFGNRRRPEERVALAKLLAEAARISDALHEIAGSESGESASAIMAAQRDLSEIRAALLTLMGRKP